MNDYKQFFIGHLDNWNSFIRFANRLQCELDAEPGLDLGVHPGDSVHRHHALPHDDLLRVVWALVQHNVECVWTFPAIFIGLLTFCLHIENTKVIHIDHRRLTRLNSAVQPKPKFRHALLLCRTYVELQIKEIFPLNLDQIAILPAFVDLHVEFCFCLLNLVLAGSLEAYELHGEHDLEAGPVHLPPRVDEGAVGRGEPALLAALGGKYHLVKGFYLSQLSTTRLHAAGVRKASTTVL